MDVYEFISKIFHSQTFKDIGLLLIGAIITLVLERLVLAWDKRGRFSIFYIDFFETSHQNRACIFENLKTNQKRLLLPIELDFVNNSGNSKLIRNLSAVALQNKTPVASLGQIVGTRTKSNPSENVSYGDVSNSYTYLIPAHDCIHTRVLFLLDEFDQYGKQILYNRLALTWYDEKNRKKCGCIFQTNDCWRIGTLDIPDEPPLLKVEKCKY